MKKYVVAVLCLTAPLSFAYQIHTTKFENKFRQDVKLVEMYASDKECNLQGVYPGMIWHKDETIEVSGSCYTDDAFVKIEFLTMNSGPQTVVGFEIDHDKIYTWYHAQIYKIKTVQNEDKVHVVLGDVTINE